MSPYEFTTRSKSFSSILKIERKDFLNILLDFPNDYVKVFSDKLLILSIVAKVLPNKGQNAFLQ